MKSQPNNNCGSFRPSPPALLPPRRTGEEETFRRGLLLAVFLGSAIAVAFEAMALAAAEDPKPVAGDPSVPLETPPARIDAKHLPNAVRVHEQVISGGLPKDEEAFAELQRLGVRTVISVDGMKPDVATSRKYGLRYIHLPHGYDGVPPRRRLELAKAVREASGPVYIHCHHGQHRSPAAAAIACVAGGLIDGQTAAKVLEIAGTSPYYRGLFQSVAETQAAGDGVLEQLEVDFLEVAATPPMAEAMIDLAHTFDRVQAIAQESWGVPAAHPDLVPRHEALLLHEHFTELLRAEFTQHQPAAFQEHLRSSDAAAAEIERLLDRWRTSADRGANTGPLQAALLRVEADCKGCHAIFRDIPQASPAGPRR